MLSAGLGGIELVLGAEHLVLAVALKDEHLIFRYAADLAQLSCSEMTATPHCVAVPVDGGRKDAVAH